MKRIVSIIVFCFLIMVSCSKSKKKVFINESCFLWSPNMMTLGTYDSLIKEKGYPKNVDTIMLPRKNNEMETYQIDTVLFVFFSDGVSYFRFHDSVQLRTINYYINQADVFIKDEKYNATYTLKKFIRKHSVDKEAIQRVSGLFYGNDTREGYIINLKINDIPHCTMEFFFNNDGFLRYINFGIYNSGILQ